MFSSSRNYDQDSLDLLCLYIRNSPIFKNTCINLNARYEFEVIKSDIHPTLKISNNKQYIDLFNEYNVNLKIICGINGIGKTTLLDCLRLNATGIDNGEIFIVYIDNKGRFVSNHPVEIEYNNERFSVHCNSTKDSTYHFSSHSDLILQDNNFSKSIIEAYLLNIKLFEGEEPLFDHFCIEFCEFDLGEKGHDFYELKSLYSKNIDEKSFLQMNPLTYILLSLIENTHVKMLIGKHTPSKYDSNIRGYWLYCIEQIKEKNLTQEFTRLRNELTAYIYARTFLSDDIPKYPKEDYYYSARELNEYSLALYGKTKSEMESLIEEIASFIMQLFPKQLVFKEDHLVAFIKNHFYYKPYLKTKRGLRYLNDLSHGEYFKLKVRFELFTLLIQQCLNYIPNDEPDIYFHPEWKRKFLTTYLDQLNILREYFEKTSCITGYARWIKNKRFNIIFTTHSPFMLSDVTKDHIVFLEKKDGLTQVRKDVPETFAGNIGEMFYEHFFMKNTIGEFAKKKIELALNEIDSRETLTKEKKKQYEKLFSIVGDRILKKLLLDKLVKKAVKNDKD